MSAKPELNLTAQSEKESRIQKRLVLVRARTAHARVRSLYD